MKLKVTSNLNILLHGFVIVGFAYFAVISGDTFLGGMMASLAILMAVDMGGCIEKRIREYRNNNNTT